MSHVRVYRRSPQLRSRTIQRSYPASSEGVTVRKEKETERTCKRKSKAPESSRDSCIAVSSSEQHSDNEPEDELNPREGSMREVVESDGEKRKGSNQYQLGSLHDAPERDEFSVDTSIKSRAVIPAARWTNEEMKTAQENDADLSLIWRTKHENKKPVYADVSPLSKTTKAYYLEWDRLELRDGLLFRRWESHNGTIVKWQLIIPEKYKDVVLEELHNSKTSAHLGVTKTRRKINERFYWYGVAGDIRAWIRRCNTCARRKSPSIRRKAKLQQDIARHPGQRIAMDILGPPPMTPAGNRYVLVIGDYFSKWIEAYPIPDQEATTCADKLTQEWICRHGAPGVYIATREEISRVE